MEVLGVDPQEELEAMQSDRPDDMNATNPSTYPTSSSLNRKAITAGPNDTTQVAPSEKSSKRSKGLTAEQKQRLALMQQEQEKIRKERVDVLSKKLLEKVSVWTETDRSQAVTEAFKTKMQVSSSRN